MRSALALMILVATPVTAQELPVRLPDGASWTITAHQRRITKGPKSAEWGLTTVKQLTLAKGSAGSGDRLTITPLSATPDPGSPPELGTARSLAIPAVMAVDETLTPGAVINVEDARAAFAKVVGRDIKGAERMADAAARAMIATEAGLASRLEGLSFDKGRSFVSEGAISNPFGGSPIRTKETYTLQSRDPQGGGATVIWRQALDPSALKESLAAMAARVAPEKRAEAQAAFAAMDMKLENVCTGNIDGATGLAVRIECTHSTSVVSGTASQTNVDHWLITQSLPETR